ncbi:MAG TPA: hypothetical protein VHB20_06885 [Verrucomicrobiae bacterium]|jgi:hypothetical protein|nr:hypothetical protein [Verrucomicrobiae bacterium]
MRFSIPSSPRVCCALLLVGGAALVGCGHSTHAADKNLPPPIAAAASQLEEVFKSADPLVKKDVDRALLAIRASDFSKASSILDELRAEPHLNYPQDKAVRNALEVLAPPAPPASG